MLFRSTTEMLREKLQKLGDNARIGLANIPDARALIKELGELLNKFGIGGLREAFVIDCDLAKDWRKLFACRGEKRLSPRRERSVSVARLQLLKQG